MKCALTCIAKDEDLYIDEWIKYHLYIGFDKIYVYRNDWTYSNNLSNVVWLDIHGRVQQLNAYNHWLKHFSQKYDWVSVIDCDEFFNLCDSYADVHQFFNDFSQYFAVGVNWRLFGDSGLSFDASNTSVLKRFTHCAASYSHEIKTSLNLSKIRDNISIQSPNVFFNNPHCVNYGCTLGKPNHFTIASNKKSWCNREYNEDYESLPIQINHYHCKTREEKALRDKHGRCDLPTSHKDYFYSAHDFDDNNKNEVEDTRLAEIAKLI